MWTFFTSTRYIIFALTVVCNAILASVSVWNLGFVQSLNLTFPLDTYLTVCGALGLGLVFAIISTELIRDHAITSRVWFECLWLGVLFVMNLVGATYLSVHSPQLCTTRARVLLGNDPCASNRVLLAFSWIISALLLWYLALLAVYALSRQHIEPHIWQSEVKDLANPACLKFRMLPSTSRPKSPIQPYSQNRRSAASIVAPKPRRPVPPVDAMSGLQSSYDIEPYQPDPIRMPSQATILTGGAPNLYSQYVQSTIAPPPVALTRAAPRMATPPSPPPLGDWPRADILSQPVRKGRKTPPSPVDVPQNVVPETAHVEQPLSPNRTRPFGPRTPNNARPRPPPLDLTDSSPPRRNRSKGKGKAPARAWDSNS